ncbi:MAG: uroporphyrinogen-III synthase, partial [Sediminibacterium sp.]|nr:uroporphyrinogen-III synthase [Sediminibacterium sp.]
HFIDYKKRKVFFNKIPTIQSLVELISNQSDKSNLLYIVSENQQDPHLIKLLKKNKISFEMLFLYRTVYADITPLLSSNNFDIICFTTPSSIHSLWHNDSSYKTKKIISATFGEHTLEAAKNLKLPISFFAPTPKHLNLCDVFEEFFKKKIFEK